MTAGLHNGQSAPSLALVCTLGTPGASDVFIGLPSLLPLFRSTSNADRRAKCPNSTGKGVDRSLWLIQTCTGLHFTRAAAPPVVITPPIARLNGSEPRAHVHVAL